MKSLKVADFDSIFNCKPDLVYYGTNLVGSKDFVERNTKQLNSIPIEASNINPSPVKTEKM